MHNVLGSSRPGGAHGATERMCVGDWVRLWDGHSQDRPEAIVS